MKRSLSICFALGLAVSLLSSCAIYTTPHGQHGQPGAGPANPGGGGGGAGPANPGGNPPIIRVKGYQCVARNAHNRPFKGRSLHKADAQHKARQACIAGSRPPAGCRMMGCSRVPMP